jgi:hypothetical protein
MRSRCLKVCSALPPSAGAWGRASPAWISRPIPPGSYELSCNLSRTISKFNHKDEWPRVIKFRQGGWKRVSGLPLVVTLPFVLKEQPVATSAPSNPAQRPVLQESILFFFLGFSSSLLVVGRLVVSASFQSQL